MRRFGLIGFPLGHSFSKKYFSAKFSDEGIRDASYELYPMEDINRLPDLVASETDLLGLNVTIPHKTAVINYLDALDEIARGAGAVNVIKIFRTGNNIRLRGYNSDVFGITESLRSYVTGSELNALVLGTGGSSRAVGYALDKMDIKATFVSRNKGEDVISYSDLNEEIISSSRLIINTTPAGMYPLVESFPPLDYDLLSKDHILFDLVYNPEITQFLKKGEERGCSIITGIRMLHLQAEKSWEIWNESGLQM